MALDQTARALGWPSIRQACARLIAVLFLAGVACNESKPPGASSAGAPGVPGPGDSLAKLSRLLLTDSNPRIIAEALLCEHVRLEALYGPGKALAIAKEVRETVYTDADRDARQRVDKILANNMIDMGCESSRNPLPPAAVGGDTTPKSY